MTIPNFTYESGKVLTEALHWIRSAIADKRVDQAKLDDGEIQAALAGYGLAKDDDPIENRYGVHMAAADAAEIIAAAFGQESQVTLSEFRATSSTASREYRKTAQLLRKKVQATGSPTFANPGDYAPTYVADVDPLPDLEA